MTDRTRPPAVGPAGRGFAGQPTDPTNEQAPNHRDTPQR